MQFLLALPGLLRVNILRVVPVIPAVRVFLAANLLTAKRAKLQVFFVFKKEFDMTLDMGKATTHRFNEDKYEWNYDGRSGFATKFHFTND
jgi:hypothetical protein